MKTYKLIISPNKFKEMRSDIWSDEHKEAVFVTNKQKYIIDLSLRGHQIRKHKKKSYQILFRKPYFYNQIHEIHLNAEYNDPSLMRNKLSMNFFHSIDVFAPNCEHVLLYINGAFKGIYLELESIDTHSLHNRNLPDGPIFYATNNDANFSLLTAENQAKSTLLEGYNRKTGNEQDDSKLLELIIKINSLTNEEFEKEIAHLVNLEGYLKWLAGAVCTQNFDGFVHNYALYRNSETGLFEISPWDYDGTWGRDIHGEPLSCSYVPIQGYNTLTARILNTNKFRFNYKQILCGILDKQFTVDFLKPKIEILFESLISYVNKDPYIRLSIDRFINEPQFILNFIQERNLYLTNKLSTL